MSIADDAKMAFQRDILIILQEFAHCAFARNADNNIDINDGCAKSP